MNLKANSDLARGLRQNTSSQQVQNKEWIEDFVTTM